MTLIERLQESLEEVVTTYDRDHPLRTADAHPVECDCFRCVVDRARATLAALKAREVGG